MNIYLDIDGTIITKDLKPANGLDDFLKYITQNHQVYWLTTHCYGDVEPVINFLKPIISKNAYEHALKIKPTLWPSEKIDAIDQSEPFLWFDDYVMQNQINALRQNGLLENWIKIDLVANPNILIELVGDFPIPINDVK